MAARLVRGCDLWLNLPRPPFEASGTSGMKAVINGGLNLSVLDGWWAEAYDGTNGWALSGEVDPDHGAQDARDAAALYDLLEQEVLPAFYDRDADGLPRSWLARIRASMSTLAPGFCAGRMLDDYLERVYAPTSQRLSRLAPGSLAIICLPTWFSCGHPGRLATMRLSPEGRLIAPLLRPASGRRLLGGTFVDHGGVTRIGLTSRSSGAVRSCPWLKSWRRDVGGASSPRRTASEGPATDFGLLAAVLKCPQSHIT